MVEVDWDTVKDNASNLLVWTYWIVGILIAFVISYVLYTRFNKQVSSILVFMATMMALYYYYVKWFVIGTPLPNAITFCPDFLTSIGPVTAGSDQFVCVDKAGVTGLGVYSDGNGSITVSGLGITTATATAEGAIVSGVTHYVITPSSNATGEQINGFCGKLSDQGLSWLSLCNA